ncbi:MAG: hypothetical protein AAGB19_16195, partial [Cyanobacteria bacterium P01_F01_bin.3]
MMFSMLRQVLPFELKYHFTSPIAYLMLAMLAFQAGWFSIGIHDWYANKSTFLNAAGFAYLCLSAGGMLLIIVIAMITASTLYRDIERRSAGFVYAYPIQEKPFFVAHFFSAWMINIIMMLGYVVGLVLVKYAWPTPDEYLGPIAWGPILHAFVFFVIPNMLTYTALAFFALVMTRRMMAVYATITTIVLIFVVGESASENSPHTDLLSIIDPFGYIYAKYQLDLMSVADKNSAFLPLNGVYWTNRALWIGISLVLFAITYARFNFKRFLEAPGIKSKIREANDGLLADNLQQPINSLEQTINSLERPINSLDHRIEIPKVSFGQGAWHSLVKTLRLTWLEFSNVTRPASFKLIMGTFVVLVLAQNLVWNSTYYIGHQYPVTSGMTSSRLINGFMMIIILMILSCELFFKDRKANLWQISGATSAKVWELQLPKLFAMFGVAFLFATTLFLGGVFSQLIQGFTDIDWLLYLQDIFGYMWGWLNYLFYICLVFVIASLTGHRFLTHCLAIGYYLFVIISFDLGLVENIRVIYGGLPGYDDYSEINRYGIFSIAGFWFFLLWFCLASFFVFVGLHFWRRGVAQSFVGRLLGRGGEIPLAAKMAALLPLIGFVLVQVIIEREVYQKRNYIPTAQLEAEAAAYEKTFYNLLSGHDVRPAVAALQIDLFPSERRAVTTASLELRNAGEQPVDRLYFNVDSFSEITAFDISGRSVEQLERDSILGMTTYSIEPSVAPGSLIKVELAVQRQYTGFSQSGDFPQGDLAANGLLYEEILPVIGYDEDKALDAERLRQIHDLPPIDVGRDEVGTSDFSADFLTDFTLVGDMLDLIVTTEVDQTPFAPGQLIDRSIEAGRQKAIFRLNGEGAPQIFVGSGRYAEREVDIEGVRVTYQYHPANAFNLEAFDTCIAQTLRYIREQLGAYPYDTLRIVEIPFYQNASYTSANVIALSEKEGWFADYSVGEVQSFVQFTLGRELIRQWLDHQGRIADVQGAGMMWRALPAALAMQIVESTSDTDSLEALIEKIRTKYNKERH